MSHEFDAASTSQSWSLAKGQAQTFIPRTAGVLKVQRGQIWATLTASALSPQPRWCPEIDAGDIFMAPGQNLVLAADQRVVIESWPVGDASTSQLQWEPMAVSPSRQRWQQSIVQPMHELGSGLVVVARAMGRLLAGVAGYGEFLVAGRGKVQSCLESNAP